MLGANVLCLKKKKKRTYSLSACKSHEKGGGSRNERARGGTLTMMQITEDTPPDMLAGAMDLTVHLPNGKVVKMSIERSTPMMDLLVQITTANHLQLSNHTLQVLGMAPSSEYSDKMLPFKPNTPIGTLDTQHIRVLPKGRVVQPKSVPPPGHQPFESTFRLKVHLPRNQLYVTRVSRNVLLEDIMRKVCEEKNLDPVKYDFKHPGNLDEVLDPKLTLSDYQITEIYVVSKGTTNLNQAFSTADIMVLRKEEERKQMHNKTGGGVFNLIFKRGKSSMGSGSVSSNDNRSISPSHSDDSRSVTPPAPPLKKEPPLDKPKPPQRKRRPAPKPPQGSVNNEEEDVVTNDTNEERRSLENGLTICHSRNSSDSSGYHEASILSEHGANASLLRNRPKSMAFGSELPPSQGTSNLTKMATHSRSTTSLIAGRKKKAAPPPPQVAVSPASSVIAQSEHPNPLVASQPEINHRPELPEVLETTPSINFVPVPKPRKRPPNAPPRTHLFQTERERIEAEVDIQSMSFANQSIILECGESNYVLRHKPPRALKRKELFPRALGNTLTLKPAEDILHINENAESKQEKLIVDINDETISIDQERASPKDNEYSMEEILASLETVKPFIMKTDVSAQMAESSSKASKINFQKPINIDDTSNETKPPEIVGVIKKGTRDSAHNSDLKDEMEDLDESMFTEITVPSPTKPREIFNQLFGIHDYEPTQSPTMSLRSSTSSIPGFNGTTIKKWHNLEELDNIADPSCGDRNEWVVAGDLSETESISTSILPSQLAEVTPEPPKVQTQEEKSLESTDSGIAQDHKEDTGFRTPPPPPILDSIIVPDEIPKTNDLIDWEYQLPSPPKAFRDSSPQDTLLETNSLGGSTDFKDSVVTSPELFEKLRTLEDKESMTSEEPPLNTLSLEHLEKRKSLVYNRELATSLKMTDSVESRPSVNTASMATFPKPAEKPARHHHDTLPNFKITTYDVPKHQNIKVFEDDTVRSNENVSYNKRNSVDLNSDTSSTDYVFYKPQPVSRSGSFSTDAKMSTKPVSRSRSTLTLNKYTTIKKELGDSANISRSSSLFNVSGLHSLEVMKVIRSKLNTSTGSTENLHQAPQKPPPTLVVQREESVPEEPPQRPDPAPVDSLKPAEPVKKYYYRGPPAVNMSTWSERPKVPVSVKEDEDYKLGNISHNGNVTQKSEITQSSGNVVIKIGPATNSTRLLAPAAYRKPLGNLNGGSEPQRPHSIAFDSSFDINRVPVVRSVEFKKPYKDFHVNNSHLNNIHQINPHMNNTSIIHLNQEQSPLEAPQHNASKVPSRPPIVKGFNNNRLSWHPSSGGSFNSTLPLARPKEGHYIPNQHVPFSQLTLRRTESSKRYMSDQNSDNFVKPIIEPNNNNSHSPKPPPPPQMPKKIFSQERSQSLKNNNNSEDVRDMLMESIRNFGGKKGLKTVKA